MRQVFAVLFVILIGVALFTLAGTLFPEGSLLNNISDAIREVVRAIGDAIAGSVRGVA